jgi:hypothetical protein
MKHATLAVIFGAAVVLMVGCGNDPTNPDSGNRGYYNVNDVNVHGRMVTCVSWRSGYGGGISCDWDHAQ